jgi:hypothetical protein
MVHIHDYIAAIIALDSRILTQTVTIVTSESLRLTLAAAPGRGT